ncbi:12322_t:CDS:2, partial [Entrophospora sp. SA101]
IRNGKEYTSSICSNISSGGSSDGDVGVVVKSLDSELFISESQMEVDDFDNNVDNDDNYEEE